MSPDGDFAAEQAAAGVFHHRKGLRQNLVQRIGQFLVVLNLGQPRLPISRLLAQDIVRKLLQLRLKLIDFGHHGTQLLNFPFVARTDDFFDDVSDHLNL